MYEKKRQGTNLEPKTAPSEVKPPGQIQGYWGPEHGGETCGRVPTCRSYSEEPSQVAEGGKEASGKRTGWAGDDWEGRERKPGFFLTVSTVPARRNHDGRGTGAGGAPDIRNSRREVKRGRISGRGRD